MTITTASKTASIDSSVPFSAGKGVELIQHHPAAAFFELYSSHVPGVSAVMDASLKAGWGPKAVGLKGLLGCLVDCAATLVSPHSLGESDLAELELTYPRPWRGEPLYVSARVERLCDRCAVFSCELCRASDGVRVGYAQGTLTSRFGD